MRGDTRSRGAHQAALDFRVESGGPRVTAFEHVNRAKSLGLVVRDPVCQGGLGGVSIGT